MKHILLGIVGHKGSGKSTVSQMFRQIYPGQSEEIALAEPVKNFLANFFCWTHDVLFGPSENRDAPVESIIPRALLRDVHDAIRKHAPDAFIDYALSRSSVGLERDCGLTIIPDVRDPGDAQRIVQRGGMLVSVIGRGTDDGHASEAHVAEIQGWARFVVDNSQSLHHTEAQVRDIVRRIS